MAEWFKAADCKSVKSFLIVGSNPTFFITLCFLKIYAFLGLLLNIEKIKERYLYILKKILFLKYTKNILYCLIYK